MSALAEPGAAPNAATADRVRPLDLAATAFLVLNGFVYTFGHVGHVGASPDDTTFVFLSDIPAAALVALAAVGIVWHRADLLTLARRTPACAAGALLAVGLLPAFAFHPSGRGVAILGRWLAMVVLGGTFATALGPGRRLVAGALAGTTAVELALAWVERGVDGTVGLAHLGEQPIHIGGVLAPAALTFSSYLLGTWMLVGGALLVGFARRAEVRRWAPWAAAACWSAVGLGLARSDAIGLVVALPVGVVLLRRAGFGWARGAALLTVPAAAGFVAQSAGWRARAGQGGTSDGRSDLLRQATRLLARSPIDGTGPGRYVIELTRHPALVRLSVERPTPTVHCVPVLLLVEGGALVAPFLGVVGVVVARQAWRAGLAGAVLLAAIVPTLLLDHLLWSFPQGMALTGITLGALDLLAGSTAAARGDARG